VIRLRGTININEGIARTLEQLHIPRRNSCTIIPDNPHYSGMLQKVKDYVTWGPLDKNGLAAILPRIESTTEKKVDSKSILAGKSLRELDLKPRIRLHPPRGGFKSITHPFPVGDLGNRGDSINDLLVRMK